MGRSNADGGAVVVHDGAGGSGTVAATGQSHIAGVAHPQSQSLIIVDGGIIGDGHINIVIHIPRLQSYAAAVGGKVGARHCAVIASSLHCIVKGDGLARGPRQSQDEAQSAVLRGRGRNNAQHRRRVVVCDLGLGHGHAASDMTRRQVAQGNANAPLVAVFAVVVLIQRVVVCAYTELHLITSGRDVDDPRAGVVAELTLLADVHWHCQQRVMSTGQGQGEHHHAALPYCGLVSTERDGGQLVIHDGANGNGIAEGSTACSRGQGQGEGLVAVRIRIIRAQGYIHHLAGFARGKVQSAVCGGVVSASTGGAIGGGVVNADVISRGCAQGYGELHAAGIFLCTRIGHRQTRRGFVIGDGAGGDEVRTAASEVHYGRGL